MIVVIPPVFNDVLGVAVDRLKEEIDVAERQFHSNPQELRQIYAMALIEKLPANASDISLDYRIWTPLPSLAMSNLFEQIIRTQNLYYRQSSDLQLLFAAKNIHDYLGLENEHALGDDFREKLLSTDIGDEHKGLIIQAMDLTSLISMPSRAEIVGPILDRTGADLSKLDAEPSCAIIQNSKPIEVQISLFNKLYKNLDDPQVKATLNSLPKPFSDIKREGGSLRIDITDKNLEFVTWLGTRGFISSWTKQAVLSDHYIRVNLFRK